MLPTVIIGILGVALGVALIVFVTALICFFRVFHTQNRSPKGPNDYPLPEDEIYVPYYDAMIEWTKMARSLPHDEIEIQSYDGLTLRGKYYEYQAGAPLELLFHGYRGDGERDLSGGIARCFAIGRNALIIDQRGHGTSDGNVTTFGIKERWDCLSWIAYANERFGKDTRIILTGISMGAATVMMAAGEDLPENVVCVLADCGYSSARSIIRKVIGEMGLPDGLLYPFVKLGARLFGGFDLEETSPLDALSRCKIPVILIHGSTDAFVPHEMSEELFRACHAPQKKLVLIEGAGHGLAYPVNEQQYLNALRDFEAECGFLK